LKQKDSILVTAARTLSERGVLHFGGLCSLYVDKLDSAFPRGAVVKSLRLGQYVPIAIECNDPANHAKVANQSPKS
jgi:hypothetical protein